MGKTRTPGRIALTTHHFRALLHVERVCVELDVLELAELFMKNNARTSVEREKRDNEIQRC